jgi:osmotically-inducible protein OsmY
MARKRQRRRFVRGAVLGWLGAYFFDPGLGKRRRTVVRDWALARVRRAVRRGEGVERHAISTVTGKVRSVVHERKWRDSQPDDVTLAHKVESIVFRDPVVPKGQISINAEEGVVYLRGEVPDQSMLDALAERTRKVRGVRRVENLLHLPGQEAPMHH